MREYTVKSGDTLFKIAKNLLGNGNRYIDIATLNKIANPNLIFVGQKLKIPDNSNVSPIIAQPPRPIITPPIPTTVPSNIILPPNLSNTSGFNQIKKNNNELYLIIGIAIVVLVFFYKKK